jgi:hypothetical protein
MKWIFGFSIRFYEDQEKEGHHSRNPEIKKSENGCIFSLVKGKKKKQCAAHSGQNPPNNCCSKKSD